MHQLTEKIDPCSFCNEQLSCEFRFDSNYICENMNIYMHMAMFEEERLFYKGLDKKKKGEAVCPHAKELKL